MFVIRQAMPTDNATLLKLAKMVFFINLPPNETIIAGKIEQSQQAFLKASGAEVAAKPAKKKRGGGGGVGGTYSLD